MKLCAGPPHPGQVCVCVCARACAQGHLTRVCVCAGPPHSCLCVCVCRATSPVCVCACVCRATSPGCACVCRAASPRCACVQGHLTQVCVCAGPPHPGVCVCVCVCMCVFTPAVTPYPESLLTRDLSSPRGPLLPGARGGGGLPPSQGWSIPPHWGLSSLGVGAVSSHQRSFSTL